MRIENTLTGLIKTFDNEYDFVKFVRLIIIENHDNFIVNNENDCVYYINEYCDNLTIVKGG